MKDIKDYFSNSIKSQQEDSRELEKSAETLGLVEIVDQNPVARKNADQSKRKRKKKKERKVSDPEVRDVTHMLLNNLKLVSPSNTPEPKNIVVNLIVESVTQDIDSSNPMKENKQDNIENNLSIKKNAFQLMMESRNKSIGMNSPGKELENESNTNTNKEKLSARRQVFSNWSNQKGAIKRKRLEEEKDEIIEYKLKKRAVKLKKMLNVEVEEEQEHSNKKKARIKRKNRIKKIASSSEDSDFDCNNEIDVSCKEINKVIETDIVRSDKLGKKSGKHGKDTQNQIEKQDIEECMQDKKGNNEEFTFVKSDSLDSVNELSLECNIDKKNAENNPKKKKRVDKKYDTKHSNTKEEKTSKNKFTSHKKYSKNKIQSESKKKASSNEDSDFDCNEKYVSCKEKNKVKEIEIAESEELGKKSSKDGKESHNKIETNLKQGRECIKDKTEKKEKHKKKKNENIFTFEKLDKSSSNVNKLRPECNIAKNNAENKPKKKKKRDENNDTEHSNLKEIIEEKTKHLVKNSNSKDDKKVSKHKKFSEKKIKSKNVDDVLDESSQESVNFTPRTLRSWKMKIKINLDEDIISVTDSKAQKKINYVEDDEVQESSDAIELSSGSEYEEKNVRTPKKPVKIAPIFSKFISKLKEDPAVVEARKQFLMSGIPSSLKRTIEKQNSIAEQVQNVFPITRHIQQKNDSHFWNLPLPELKLNKISPLKVTINNLKCQKLTNSHIVRNINMDTDVKKVDKLKIVLNKIKLDNPNYPVFKSFRQIHEKSGREAEVEKEKKLPQKRKRGRTKKKVELDTAIVQKTESDSLKYTMWTEKYKPKCFDDIIGNSQAVKNLKKWLESWKNFSQEINSKKTRRSNSESEFETTDGDSRDSSRLPGKILILGGPCGSGKSTAVYAICNELGLNVIELNASTKRTGKRLLQEIQEATQSHQVRNSESQNFHNFFQSNSQKEKSENPDQQSEKKMCVLLVEDVDIVFEQDDGFISALIQLATTSKRPIIATTSEYDSIFVQKFLNQYEYIPFLPLSSYVLSTWLQIVFLCEGLYVSEDEIGSMLEYNKGDVRKTLLQFQYWVQSGGQLIQNTFPMKIEHKQSSHEEELEADEPNELITGDLSDNSEVFQHKNCIRSFEVLEMEEPFRIPFYLNLGLLWWNIPNILDIPNFSKDRIEKIVNITTESEVQDHLKQNNKLLALSKLYESIAYTDVIFKNNNYFDGTEPLIRHSVDVRDSLELNETFDNKFKDLEFVHDLTHCLVNGHIKNYIGKTEECRLNIAMPDKIERRWRSKQRECENVYHDALLLSTETKPTVLDYMPVLRTISRSETTRAANNTKRGNRFRNYLRDLGINSNEKIIKIACSTLNEFV